MDAMKSERTPYDIGAIASMLETARDLREDPNADCKAIEEAIFWEDTAVATIWSGRRAASSRTAAE